MFRNSLGFRIDFYENNVVICFDKRDKLQIGDCISLLFDDGKMINYIN